MSRTLVYLPLCFLLFLNGCAVRVWTQDDRSGPLRLFLGPQQFLEGTDDHEHGQSPLFGPTHVHGRAAQVVASYTFEGSAGINLPDWEGSPAGSAAGVSGRWAESPVITYNPLVGEKFTRSLLQPIPPIALFSLVQAGWPIDVVFAIGLRAINGLYANTHIEALKKRGDTDFYRLLKMLRELQLTGSFAMRVQRKGEAEAGVVVFRPRPGRRGNRGDRTYGPENARPQSGSPGVQPSLWRCPKRRH